MLPGSAVLKDDGSDEDAAAVKVFLLMELSKFEDALTVLGTLPDDEGSRYSFEKVLDIAYAMHSLSQHPCDRQSLPYPVTKGVCHTGIQLVQAWAL